MKRLGKHQAASKSQILGQGRSVRALGDA